MTTIDRWTRILDTSEPSAWPDLLEEHSGLPGPRANLELMAAVAGRADEEMAGRLLEGGSEYQAACAAAILGRRASDPPCEARARALASDGRWRVRMGVEIGLQLLGDEALGTVQGIASAWAGDDDPLVQRAAVAAVCEPRLLRTVDAAAFAVELCARVTRSLAARDEHERRQEGVRALRKALGYCWSVAVAADPEPGLAAFRALDTGDADVAWIVRENRGKARLRRLLSEG